MQSYIRPLGVGDLQFKYFTEEAVEWYDPIKPYTKLEYEWVLENLDLEGQVVIDAGSHHGNYAIVFKGCYMLYCIEVVPEFVQYTRENLDLNGIRNYWAWPMRLTADNVSSSVVGQKPDIYKMDIEGGEFQALPVELRENPQVHTWIVEVHPWAGQPNDIAKLFPKRYELLKVDREAMKVRPYMIGEDWTTHATLIARYNG